MHIRTKIKQMYKKLCFFWEKIRSKTSTDVTQMYPKMDGLFWSFK